MFNGVKNWLYDSANVSVSVCVRSGFLRLLYCGSCCGAYSNRGVMAKRHQNKSAVFIV